MMKVETRKPLVVDQPTTAKKDECIVAPVQAIRRLVQRTLVLGANLTPEDETNRWRFECFLKRAKSMLDELDEAQKNSTVVSVLMRDVGQLERLLMRPDMIANAQVSASSNNIAWKAHQKASLELKKALLSDDDASTSSAIVFQSLEQPATGSPQSPLLLNGQNSMSGHFDTKEKLRGDVSVDVHRQLQEDLSQDMLMMAKRLTHNARAFQDVLQTDAHVMDSTSRTMMKNSTRLQRETERVRQLRRKYARMCSLQIMLTALVIMTFVAMFFFMRLFPKRRTIVVHVETATTESHQESISPRYGSIFDEL